MLVEPGVRVIGVASAANDAWLSAHGVTPVNYGEDLEGRVRAAAPDGVDALIDLFGPDYLDLGLALGVKADRLETIISFERACQIGAKDHGGLEATDPATIVADIAAAAAAGIVEVPIAATYPWSGFADAYAQLEQRHTGGKIILVP